MFSSIFEVGTLMTFDAFCATSDASVMQLLMQFFCTSSKLQNWVQVFVLCKFEQRTFDTR
jgi:hypothetical protein